METYIGFMIPNGFDADMILTLLETGSNYFDFYLITATNELEAREQVAEEIYAERRRANDSEFMLTYVIQELRRLGIEADKEVSSFGKRDTITLLRPFESYSYEDCIKAQVVELINSLNEKKIQKLFTSWIKRDIAVAQIKKNYLHKN